MLDRADATFDDILERTLRRWLHGDKEVQGLYESLSACQSWDQYNRSCGQIHGFKIVLDEMQKIRQRMNGDDMSSRQSDRSMN